ncbi:nucleotide exchange factor GrpE [Mycoplasma sp. 332]|uniref:nucleotide exchange factor GrpE n=1 Tax=Mycoplasma sp. 332 TaxID=3458236 RepID=UPI0040360F89
MWDFKKYEKVNFELCEKENHKEKITHFSYVWDYDDVDPIINEILNKGKSEADDLLSYRIKKKSYVLKLVSVVGLDDWTKKVIEKNAILTNELSEKKDRIKSLEETIEKINNEKEELRVKSIIEANKFKDEVIAIQKKAQDLISDHKQKNNDHQEKQIAEAKKYALQSFMENIIQPINNFEKAILAAKKIDNDTLKNFIVGFHMLYNQVENILFDFGLNKIIPNVGDKFDSNIHQVYELVASDLEKDTILEVKNIGYKLNDRTIKPALVIVSK